MSSPHFDGRQATARAIRNWLDRGDLADRYRTDPEFYAAVQITRRVLERVAVAMSDLFPLATQLIDDLLGQALITMRLEDMDRVKDLAALMEPPPVDPAFRLGSDPRLAGLSGRCTGRDCGARIFMAVTSRSLMPLDYDPVPVHRGTVRLSWPENPRPNAMTYPFAVVVDNVDMRVVHHPGQLWYRPHWADCPNADSFRTKKIFGGQGS